MVRGDTEFTFVRSESGALGSVRIVRPLAHPEEAFNIVTMDSEGRRSIKSDMDKETLDATMEDFKKLESMLSFSVEIHHIDWQSPTVSLVAETPEEQTRIQFNNIHLKRAFNQEPKFLSDSELRTIVNNIETYESLWTCPRI